MDNQKSVELKKIEQKFIVRLTFSVLHEIAFLIAMCFISCMGAALYAENSNVIPAILGALCGTVFCNRCISTYKRHYDTMIQEATAIISEK